MRTTRKGLQMKKFVSLALVFVSVVLLVCSQLTLASHSEHSPGYRQARENRIALVIGNSAYPQQPLKNPVNDATSMAALLRTLGFQVTLVIDTNLREMEKAIDNFITALTPGRVALFYYAGHGIQIDSENYLVPTDFVLKDEADAKYSSYSASRLLERLESGNNGLNIIILDACRNNPFLPMRSSSRGLAIMRSDQGTFIAFATAPGKTADDNPSGSNGLFTKYLLQGMTERGLTLDQLFGRVRTKVAQASNKRQVPWVSTSVIGEFYFSPSERPSDVEPKLGSSQLPRTKEEGIQVSTPQRTKLDDRYGPTNSYAPTDSMFQEGTCFFSFMPTEFRIGKDKYEFRTSWSICFNRTCVKLHSDHLAGIANTKLTDFSLINDVTGYDMSSRVREAKTNEILVVKNKAGFYALVQIKTISYLGSVVADHILTIRYKIIPQKLQSTWKPTPEKYVSRSKSGRVVFNFNNNDGIFTLGENDFKVVTKWDKSDADGVFLFSTYAKSVSIVPDDSGVQKPKGTQILKALDWLVRLSEGKSAVLRNSNGSGALIKVVSVIGDEVVFEYQVISH